MGERDKPNEQEGGTDYSYSVHKKTRRSLLPLSFQLRKRFIILRFLYSRKLLLLGLDDRF
jgi:hypothetical protein